MQVAARRRPMAKAVAVVFLLSAVLTAVTSLAHGQCGEAARCAAVYELRGERVAARFQMGNDGLKVAAIVDRRSGATLHPGEAFSLLLRDGRVILASQLNMYAPATKQKIAPDAKASRAAERVAGQKLCADLSTTDNLLTVHWCAVLREGANYVRQEVTLKAGARQVDIAEVQLFDFDAQGAEVAGWEFLFRI
jgi:hypothetical protein